MSEMGRGGDREGGELEGERNKRKREKNGKEKGRLAPEGGEGDKGGEMERGKAREGWVRGAKKREELDEKKGERGEREWVREGGRQRSREERAWS